MEVADLTTCWAFNTDLWADKLTGPIDIVYMIFCRVEMVQTGVEVRLVVREAEEGQDVISREASLSSPPGVALTVTNEVAVASCPFLRSPS